MENYFQTKLQLVCFKFSYLRKFGFRNAFCLYNDLYLVLIFLRDFSAIWILPLSCVKTATKAFYLVILFCCYRNSRSQMFFNTGFLKNSQYSQENIHNILFLIKLRLQHRCFPVNIAKYLRTAFL